MTIRLHSRPCITQFCAGFAPGDAISTEALNIRHVTRQWGCPSEIYSWPDHIDPEMRSECKPVSQFNGAATDILLYHFSIGSPMTRYALGFPGKKVMIYHNITPGHYFRRYDPKIAGQLDEGRKELAGMSQAFDLALADSEFNRKELEFLKYRNTAVLPILFDPSQLDQAAEVRKEESAPTRVHSRPKSAIHNPQSSILRSDPELTTILFVGRLAPNKKAEDLLKIFGLYQKFMNPKSCLIWVGSWGSLQLYYLELQKMVHDIGLKNVLFAGHVSPAELAEAYRRADVFASTSEHEGFCVPILECFHYGVPVIAYPAGALPETLADAGLILADKDHGSFAETINRVVKDSDLNNSLVQRGRARLHDHFSFSRVAGLLRGYLEPLI
jgi:glycosyltransferase involved in cell wall biosynthesis